jgi:hypothetical protein
MSERHETHHAQPETAGAGLEAARAEKLAELRATAETGAENNRERADAAREIIKQQDRQPEQSAPKTEAEQTPAPSRPLIPPRLNYAHTMATLQRQLAPVSRTFSKFIHTPTVEKTSEVLESTIARPSVTLGALWTALIVGGVFYFTARSYGYALSGSEMLFSFIVGAVLGLVLEGIGRALKRR